MDTTKEYIEMCHNATGIQEQWKPAWGDFASDIVCRAKVLPFIPDMPTKFIWLPRQDQLQDMIAFPKTHKNKPDIMHKIDALSSWMHHYKPLTYQYTTGEQLWLAFVMHEKYGKSWNGKEWIKC